MLNFTQFECFLAAARSKRFSHAAEDLYVSQSSFSKQIKSLEEELGVDLFVRGYSEVSLTPAGEMFLAFASKTFKEYEGVLLGLGQYSTSAHLRVRIGALPLMNAYDLHSDLADFQVENMSTEIDFYERNQGDILRRLDMNRLDVAILRTDRLSPEEYDWIPLVRDEIVIVCSNQHPLARTRRVSIGDLKDERFVLIDKQSSIYETFHEECRKNGFVPNVTFTHTRHEPLLSAVSKNIGITALPRGLTRGKNQATLFCIPLQNPLYSDVGLVTTRGRTLTPWAEKLVQHFAKAYKAPADPSDVSPSRPEG